MLVFFEQNYCHDYFPQYFQNEKRNQSSKLRVKRLENDADDVADATGRRTMTSGNCIDSRKLKIDCRT